MASVVDSAVQKFLKKNEFLEVVESGEGENKRVRIKCQLTQHEMLPRVDLIEQHLKSKKFIKARDWYCHDYSQYEPYIVPHRKLGKSLYCNVTGTILNRIPSEVEKHVNGKRYKRMKEHVKIKVTKSEDDEEMQGNGEFDADAFEFENSQVLYSDEEEEEGEKELSENELKGKKIEEEDDMADLYPDDESDEEAKDEDGDETMEEKPKKRSADGKAVTKKTRHHNKKVKKSD